MNAGPSTPKVGPLSPLPLPVGEDQDEGSDAAHRRLLGPVLGAVLGLAFGLVSQYGNVVLVPGVPIYQPPFGAAGNLLLCVAVGAVLGLVTAWPKNAIIGVIAGCAASGLLVEIAIMLTEQDALDVSKATVTLFTFLPIAAMLALPVGIVRWALNKQEEARREGAPTWRRIPRPLLLVLIAAASGALLLYPARGRIVLPRMNAIVRAGLNAADRSALPATRSRPKAAIPSTGRGSRWAVSVSPARPKTSGSSPLSSPALTTAGLSSACSSHPAPSQGVRHYMWNHKPSFWG
jgi:hypothetical protein